MARGYDEHQRSRNRRTIVRGAALSIMLILIVGAIRSSGLAPIVAGIIFVVLVAAVLWWLFAAAAAQPLPEGRKFARMWGVSKKWEDTYGGGSS